MRIVVLDGYSVNPGDLSWNALGELGELTVYDRTDACDVVNRAQGADVILTNKVVISDGIMERLAGLKYIGVLATGYNVVDVEAAARRGIVVTNVPAYSTDSVVQMTFAQEDPAPGSSIDDTLYAAMKGANLFLGLSGPGTLKPDMLKGMAESPVIFACANPVPEIGYEEAKAVRPDAIMGTGRSDYPNQVNNVSGFPFIFRGALDVRASKINEEMKIAAARALAELALEPVPEEVRAAYHGRNFSFGPEYIIPMPLDPRIIEWVAPAVAMAALESGVARGTIDDIGGSVEAYRAMLRTRMAAARARGLAHCESYTK